MIIRDYSVPNIRGIREIRGEATQIARITRIIHGQLMIIRDYSAPNIPREREKKWKQCLCKPGSVSHTPLLTYEPSAIYLLRKSPCVSSILPSTVSSKGNRTGSPQTMVYMNLQPPDGTARWLPIGWWSLTHAFSPLPHTRHGGCFLLPTPAVADSFYFRKWGSLCCPDFPLLRTSTAATEPRHCFH